MLILDKAYVCEFCETVHKTDKVFGKCFKCDSEICENCEVPDADKHGNKYCLECWRHNQELENTI